jgi:hypothetical protein
LSCQDSIFDVDLPYLFLFFREFKLVAKGTYEYTLSEEDVGSRVMFSYTPVNYEGECRVPLKYNSYYLAR